jgi:uncharacterized protein (DUF58 family)
MLLDPQLLSSIADLELVARVTVDGTVAGLHRSPFHGYSAEFTQYRHYRPGDDLKYIDWKLLARTDRVYTKQYLETTNLLAQLVVDASASMGFSGRNGVSKLDYARLAAAALAHLSVRQGDAAGLVVFDDRVREYLPSRPGQPHLRRLLVTLSKVRASGETRPATPLRRAADLLKRRGSLIVFSDLYDEDIATEAELRRAARIGHDVTVFHVLTPEEIDFGYGGDVEFEDLESHRTLLANAPAARDAYRAEFAAFLERWRTRCASYGIDYTRLTTDMPLDSALREYLFKRTAARTP